MAGWLLFQVRARETLPSQGPQVRLQRVFTVQFEKRLWDE